MSGEGQAMDVDQGEFSIRWHGFKLLTNCYSGLEAPAVKCKKSVQVVEYEVGD